MSANVVAYEKLPRYAGRKLGVSDWIPVTQAEVNAYADATNDHQWFCEDSERAKRESPYGAAVAPGYFILALVPGLLKQIWYVAGAQMAVNYGINRLRFPGPLLVGERARLHATLVRAAETRGGREVTLDLVVEASGQAKPVCVATVVYRFLASERGAESGRSGQ